MVSAVEAAPFEDDRDRVYEAAGFPPARRAYSYRLFIEPLPSFESRATTAALIFVDRQACTSRKRRPYVEVALIILLILALLINEC
jgi:hypothetical protein